MKTVAIVISAIYKPNTLRLKLSKEELISLEHLRKHLNKYDKYFMVPDVTDINKHVLGKFRSVKLPERFHLIKFPKRYFGSAQKQNDLLISNKFYLAFKNYEYILFYHLDALVFSDQLLEWCNKGYDYTYAPWLNSRIALLTKIKGAPMSGGNGGFSLRKVHSFLQVLNTVDKLAKRKTSNLNLRKLWFWMAVLTGRSHKIWLNAPVNNYPFNEDGFWSLEAPKYINDFKVAPFREALKFAFEKFPRKCFKLNKNRLPFGCHAWERYDKDFWLPYL